MMTQIALKFLLMLYTHASRPKVVFELCEYKEAHPKKHHQCVFFCYLKPNIIQCFKIETVYNTSRHITCLGKVSKKRKVVRESANHLLVRFFVHSLFNFRHFSGLFKIRIIFFIVFVNFLNSLL